VHGDAGLNVAPPSVEDNVTVPVALYPVIVTVQIVFVPIVIDDEEQMIEVDDCLAPTVK
jgi:hypothetical protein